MKFLLLAAGALLVMKLATASLIPPGPVWSGYPAFEAPCDGYTLGLPPFGCITGEIRTISAAGEVLTGYLKPTVLADPAPPVDRPIDLGYLHEFLGDEKPMAKVASPVPEPELRDLFVLVLAGVIMWRLLRAETAGGSKK